MRAVVYHGPGQKAWEKVPMPVVIDDTDAVVRVDATTICGTDLHILKGDVPAVTDGRILGHEAVGVPATFELATQLARPGGHIANIGSTASPPRCTSRISGSARSRSPPADRFVAHHFTLDQFDEA